VRLLRLTIPGPVRRRTGVGPASKLLGSMPNPPTLYRTTKRQRSTDETTGASNDALVGEATAE
jgi:hypothetical protein